MFLAFCLFIGFIFVFLLLTPRNSAAGALLQEVTRPVRASGAPAWQNALNVDYLAKPFTLLRSLFTPEPDPTLVRRLMLAGYRKPAHADIYVGLRLAIPATLGILIALFARSNAIMYFIIGVGLGFFAPEFWLNWAPSRTARLRASSNCRRTRFSAAALKSAIS